MARDLQSTIANPGRRMHPALLGLAGNGIQKITNEEAGEDRGELPVHRCIRDAHLADGSIT